MQEGEINLPQAGWAPCDLSCFDVHPFSGMHPLHPPPPSPAPRPVCLINYPLVFLVSAFLYLTATGPVHLLVCPIRRSVLAACALAVNILTDYPRLPISAVAANAIVFFYSRNNPVDSIGGEIAMSQCYFVGAVDNNRLLLLLCVVLHFISSL